MRRDILHLGSIILQALLKIGADLLVNVVRVRLESRRGLKQGHAHGHSTSAGHEIVVDFAPLRGSFARTKQGQCAASQESTPMKVLSFTQPLPLDPARNPVSRRLIPQGGARGCHGWYLPSRRPWLPATVFVGARPLAASCVGIG